MTPSPPLLLATHLSRLIWREGLAPTHDAARALLRRALPSSHPSTWTCDVVAIAYLHLRERLDAEIEAGERLHGQHPAQEP